MSGSEFRYLSWLLAAGGGVLLLWTVRLVRSHLQETRGWRRAEGVVIDRVSRAVTPGNPYYFSVIEFSADNGSSHRFEAGLGRWVNAPVVGDHVPLLYDAAMPSRVIVARALDRWFIAGSMGAFGLIALFLAGLIHSLLR